MKLASDLIDIAHDLLCFVKYNLSLLNHLLVEIDLGFYLQQLLIILQLRGHLHRLSKVGATF
jgi:hypothetical protein